MRFICCICFLTILWRTSANSVDTLSEVEQKHKYDFSKRNHSFLFTNNTPDKCCQKTCLCINNRVIRSTDHDLREKETSGPEDDDQIPGWAIGLACIVILFVILLLAQCIFLLRKWCCLCICPCDMFYWEKHPH